MAEAPIAFVDLEMTGLDVALDRVVEVCVDRVVGGRREVLFKSLVRPDARIGGAAHIHGLDDAALTGAPSFAAIADALLEVTRGAIVVAHAAEWDVRFLHAEFARIGRPVQFTHFLDTLTLARRSFSLSSYSLDSLCREFKLDRGRAHRAEDDVLALRAVFERCAALLAPTTPRDLWEVRISERRARESIVTACEAAIEHGLPIQVTYRASRRPAEPLVMVLTDVLRDMDPPRVIG